MSTDRPEFPQANAEVWEALDAAAPERLPAEAGSRIERALRLAMEVRSSRGGGAMYSRTGLVAAALVALVLGGAAGFGIGTARTAADGPTVTRTATAEETTTMDGKRYLLLIRDTEAVEQAIEEHGIEAIVQEYGGWAGSLAEAGRLMAAEKLTDSPRWVGESAPSASDISGFFLITAASEAEALEIARNSPHARYGGVLEVREIEPTEG